MEEFEVEIARLEAILNAGVASVNVDGVLVQYDLDAVRRRLAELKRRHDPASRPRVARADLSGF